MKLIELLFHFQIMNYIKFIKIFIIITTAVLLLILYFYNHDKDDMKGSPFEGRYKNINCILTRSDLVVILLSPALCFFPRKRLLRFDSRDERAFE